jgi:hypothetical protein
MVVVRRGPAAGWFEGDAVAGEGRVVVVEFEDSEVWEADEGVILVRGEPLARQFAPARLHASERGLKTFHTIGPWRPLNRRAHRRYRAELQADIFEAGDPAALPAQVLDISMGGLSVAAPCSPAQAIVGVRLHLAGGRATFPSEVLSVVHHTSYSEVHLRFSPLDTAQRILLAGCIELLRLVESQDEHLFAA